MDHPPTTYIHCGMPRKGKRSQQATVDVEMSVMSVLSPDKPTSSFSMYAHNSGEQRDRIRHRLGGTLRHVVSWKTRVEDHEAVASALVREVVTPQPQGNEQYAT